MKKAEHGLRMLTADYGIYADEEVCRINSSGALSSARPRKFVIF
jgi:hypothetical protein